MAAPGHYLRTCIAWAFYDWANSAFALIFMAAVFPFFYQAMVERSLAAETGSAQVRVEAPPPAGEEEAAAVDPAASRGMAYWGFTAGIAVALIALLAPIFGSVSDRSRSRKKFLALFALVGMAGCVGAAFVPAESWLLASLFYIVGDVGFAGSIVFYDALLPHFARPRDLDRISTAGYALGYLGGGVLLALNLWWITCPGDWGMPDGDFAIRVSFLSVALWWGLFTIPLLLWVPEPEAAPGGGKERGWAALTAGFRQLAATAGKLRRYKVAILFLVAFWLYADGVGTVQKMAGTYGKAIGFDRDNLITALLLTQFFGVPCAFAYGWAARWIGAKRAVLLGLVVFMLICTGAYFMQNVTHFYILALAVGAVQGGVQGLSRSLYAGIIPRRLSGEFFAFFSVMSKFAGFLGPILFGWLALGASRLPILAVGVLFLVGGVLLLLTDIDQGRRAAAAEDRAWGEGEG